jgi:hypothetical protein
MEKFALNRSWYKYLYEASNNIGDKGCEYLTKAQWIKDKY